MESVLSFTLHVVKFSVNIRGEWVIQQQIYFHWFISIRSTFGFNNKVPLTKSIEIKLVLIEWRWLEWKSAQLVSKAFQFVKFLF